MEIVGQSESSSEPEIRDGAVRLRRGGRSHKKQGGLCIFFILASTSGYWHRQVAGAELGAFQADLPLSPALLEGGAFLVGAVVGRWILRHYEDHSTNESDDNDWVSAQARALTGHVDSFGLVAYQAYLAVALERYLPVDPSSLPAQILELSLAERVTSGGSLGQWCGKAAHGGMSLIVLSPMVALAVVLGHLRCFHAVSITRRTHHRRLPAEAPTSKIIHHFVKHLAPVRPRLGRALQPRAPRWHEQVPAQRVIKWLRAVRFLKSEKENPEATKAFAHVLCASDDQANALLANHEGICIEVLRKARVRLDCVAMMCWRRLFSTMDLSSTWFQLWIDGSPQWRGREMLAMSFEVVVPGEYYQRKLFPVVALRSSQLDACSKAMCLLWAIFLLVGPSAAAVRQFLSRVRCIVSDCGVERKIAELPDIVDDFFWFIGARATLPPIGNPGPLFPAAVRSPGWRHQWDGLIKRGLSLIDWFPSWLALLKHVVSWFRDENMRADTMEMFRALNLTGLCQIVQGMHLPNFAAWRWNTLELCCRGLERGLVSIRAHFDPGHFAKKETK